MRSRLFLLAVIVFLTLVSCYQAHVLRELTANLEWLMQHALIKLGQP